MKKFIVLILFLFLAVKPVLASDYVLPYPGLLPDSPLYVFKVIRDQVVTWTIRDSEKKAFYLLLLSDKRLAAGEVLANNGKTVLGATTISKSQDYFKQAVDLAEKLPKEKRENLVTKLVVAGAKHKQVLAGLISKISIDDDSKLQDRVMELYLQR